MQTTLMRGKLSFGVLLCWMVTPALAIGCATGSGQKDIVDTAVGAGSFKTLATALTKADLVGALKQKGPFTVFAPTDEAFAKLPKRTLDSLLRPENKAQLTAILTYHVVPGRVPASQAVKLSNAKTLNGQQLDLMLSGKTLNVDKARVVKTDINCTNGVIHVIDSVMLPSDKDIIATANGAGMFKTLLAAISTAELTGALQSDGPFTVFAPTDEAFAKLPAGTVDSLLRPENRDKLVSILKYHVASGRAFAADALKTEEIKTLQGGTVRVRIVNGKPRANDAMIVKTDIDASNGVVHVIDTVLMPSNKTRMGAANPRRVIEVAIGHGAPLFNDGNPAACTAVYEVAATSLLAMDRHIPTRTRSRLMGALRDVSRAHDPSEQAWILRDALDAAYAEM